MSNEKKPGKPPRKKAAPRQAERGRSPEAGSGATLRISDERLLHVEALAAQLLATPTVTAGRELAAEAKALEDYFRNLRLQALAVAEGEAALESIRAALPEPFPPLHTVPPLLPSEPGFPGSPPEFVTRVGRQMAVPLRAPAAATPRPTTAGGDNQPDLSDFFQGVCKAVLNAQRALDRESLVYALDLKDSPVPPSLFSIPNIKAEVKMGFSEVTDEGIKAIIFNDSTQIEQHGESTVSFEVAAAPPPPGALDRFAPPARFLFRSPERDTVFAAVEVLRSGFSADAQAILDPSWKSRALVMRLPDTPGLFQYLLMVPGPQSRLLVLELTDKDRHTSALTRGDDVAALLAGVVAAIRAALDTATP